MIDDLL